MNIKIRMIPAAKAISPLNTLVKADRALILLIIGGGAIKELYGQKAAGEYLRKILYIVYRELKVLANPAGPRR
jgi:hypothetical protein